MIGVGDDCLTPVYKSVKSFETSEHDKHVYGLPYFSLNSSYLRLPCGHCINCRIRRSKELSLRLEMEATQHANCCFVTLTYSPEHLPKIISDVLPIWNKETQTYDFIDGCFETETLFPRDAQLFMKSLRKQLDYPIRFCVVGEYGTKKSRPHLHYLLFGLKPDDYKYIGLEKHQWFNKHFKADYPYVWHKGFVDISPFYPQHCIYVAGYIQKKLYGKGAKSLAYPEFEHHSKGLGLVWFREHEEQILELGYIPHGDYKSAIPRYFRRLMVKEGKLPAFSVLDYFFQQKDERDVFIEKCKENGFEPAEVFRQRRIDAKFRQKKWLATREKNKGVYNYEKKSDLHNL